MQDTPTTAKTSSSSTSRTVAMAIAGVAATALAVYASTATRARRRWRERFRGGVPSPRPHKAGSVSFFSTSSSSSSIVSIVASSMAAQSAAKPPQAAAAAEPGTTSPSSDLPPPPADLVEAASAAGQEQLFADWSELTDAQRARRATDVASVDFDALAVALSAALGAEARVKGSAASEEATTASRNAGCFPWDSVVPLFARSPGAGAGSDDADLARWRRLGLGEAAAGRLAVLLLAGGQGTRLGSSAPKGCFDLGLPSRTTLFGLHAKRVLSLRRWAGEIAREEAEADGGACPERLALVDLYVMTSNATHEATVEHFRRNDYYGLGEDGVFFFRQGEMPCVTERGKVILGPLAGRGVVDAGGGVATSPDGNGGVYSALVSSGALDRMETRGVASVDVVCVDNALASPGDPAFVGACVERGVDVGCRAVARERADEKVGVFAASSPAPAAAPASRRLRVLEYSELDPRQATAVDPSTNEPLYAWANVCMHYFSTSFLRSAAADLGCGPGGRALYHCARKKIPSVDGDVDGIKLELFIFDAFDVVPEDKVLVCGVSREDSFAPVKNADSREPGVVAPDTPSAARDALLRRGKRWIERASAKAAAKAAANGADAASSTWVCSLAPGEVGVEVPPEVSYGGEGLEELSASSSSPRVFEKASDGLELAGKRRRE